MPSKPFRIIDHLGPLGRWFKRRRLKSRSENANQAPLSRSASTNQAPLNLPGNGDRYSEEG
jgi:hypothetical protein